MYGNDTFVRDMKGGNFSSLTGAIECMNGMQLNRMNNSEWHGVIDTPSF